MEDVASGCNTPYPKVLASARCATHCSLNPQNLSRLKLQRRTARLTANSNLEMFPPREVTWCKSIVECCQFFQPERDVPGERLVQRRTLMSP